MRVPFSWLKEYVDWQGYVEELAELLTMSGTEVEGIDRVGAPHDPENLSRFVVGKVVTREKHPNADKLSLCTVDVGERNGGVKQIVCGADNFQAGDVVAVSMSGAVLENGLKLKKANLRGVESDGMMMSEQELGYEEKSPGIVVLPADWTVGAPLQDYLPVSEAVLELELTSNRPDCFSIYGIAREVAAASGAKLAPPPTAGPAVLGGAPAEQSIAVEVVDADLCPRYAARVIRGMKAGGLAALAQGAAHARRHAPDQQHRRRDQLRDARLGPAAARLRRRQDRRRHARRAAGASRREDRHARRGRAHARRRDARDRRRRDAAGHRRRVRRGRRRGRRDDDRRRARGGELQRSEHPAHRDAHRHPQRGQQPFREGARPGDGAGRARFRLRGCSPSSAAAPWRPAWSTCGAARRSRAACPTGRRRPTPCSATRCPADRAGDAAAPARVRGRRDRASAPSGASAVRRASAPTSSARSTSSRRSGAWPATAWRPRRCPATARRAG